MNETEKFFSFKRIPEPSIKKPTAANHDSDQGSSSRGQSRDKLRSTSSLYQKMHNDLVKKLKSLELNLKPVSNPIKLVQSSLTSKASAKLGEALTARETSPKQIYSPKIQKFSNVVKGNIFGNAKKTTGIKQEAAKISTTRKLAQPSERDICYNSINSMQKLSDKTANAINVLRNSYSKGDGIKPNVSRLKLDLKGISKK